MARGISTPARGDGWAMKKLGILLSGRGSNFEAIARNALEGKIPARIAVVISNRDAIVEFEFFPQSQCALEPFCTLLRIPHSQAKVADFSEGKWNFHIWRPSFLQQTMTVA